MKKSSSECISCITYIFEEKNSGRLAGMTVVTINSDSRPHCQTLAVVAGMSRICPGIETKWRCRKIPGDKFILSTLVLSPQRFCKLCKLAPPLFARVPMMGKIIADYSTLPKAETPMRLMASPGFRFRQRLNLQRPGCRHAASREKTGLIFDSSRRVGKTRRILCPNDTFDDSSSGKMTKP
jgi:hypothetical protein